MNGQLQDPAAFIPKGDNRHPLVPRSGQES